MEERERIGLLFCQAKREQSRLPPQELYPLLERVMRSFIMFQEQDIISSWTTFRLVGIKVKFQTLSTIWFQPI